MRRLRSCVVVVGALVALWAGVGVALGAVAPDTRNAPSESDFVARVNQARGAAGLGALAVRDDLVAVARQHSTDMANRHRLYHNPSLASSVTGWQRVGENVGTGGDVPSIEDAFMHSQVHRDDILSPYFTEIGVGVVWDGSTLWVTQVFRQPSSSAAAAPAPAPARRPQAVAPRPAPVAPPATAAPVTVPPASVVAHPPTESRSTAVSGGENASVLEDARATDAPVRAPAVLGELREQAIAVPASVPRIPVPVGVAAGLLALVTALEGVVVRRLGLA